MKILIVPDVLETPS